MHQTQTLDELALLVCLSGKQIYDPLHCDSSPRRRTSRSAACLDTDQAVKVHSAPNDSVLTFESRQRGTDRIDQRFQDENPENPENRISEVHGDVPQFICDIQEPLQARRDVSDRQRVSFPFIVSAFFLSECPYSLFSHS